MHTGEDSAAIAVRILQRRERERPVEAAERRLARMPNLGDLADGREENDRLHTALAEAQNEIASLRGYVAALEDRLKGIYAEMALPAVSLKRRGIGRRFVRATVVALLGAAGVLALQMTTPFGARLTRSLRVRSVGGWAAQLREVVRRRFSSATSQAPASAQPATPPAPPVPAKEPQPPAGDPPTPPPAAEVAPPEQTAAHAAAVAPPPSHSRRRATSATSKFAKPHSEGQGAEVPEARIPACSDNDPLCGISKQRPPR